MTTEPADTAPAPDPDMWLAVCHPCAERTGEPATPVPFGTRADRDRWAAAHADARNHIVMLARQRPGPGQGTTVEGRALPEQQANTAAAGAVRGTAPPPLVAFVVPAGGEPNLMCRVPNRAGAAWLAYAAHACLLGRQGSAGIPEPHRVMFIARVTPPTGAAGWVVRVDGVLGATGKTYGQPVGDEYGITRDATLPDVEDAVEALIDDEYRLGRHTFSVLLVTDTGVGDPPDEHADTALRDARRALYETRPPDTGEQAIARPGPNGECCDQHNRHCEPPADLCCADCGEVMHPAHPPGIPCVYAGPTVG